VVDGRWYVVGGRWGRGGFRIEELGVRTKSICFPPSAYSRLPTAIGWSSSWLDSCAVPQFAKRRHADRERKGSNFKKMKKLCGNLFQNKGPAFHGHAGAVNVVENKGSYALKAGMSLKNKVLGGRSYVVGDR
jgi:hypothetical protein